MKRMNGVVAEKEKEIRDVVEMINRNIEELYVKIQRADTVALLKRLNQVPRDIANIEARLLCANLEKDDFTLLKSAYNRLVEEGFGDTNVGEWPISFSEKYMQQFFQHFLGKAVADVLLREKIVKFFPSGISVSFTNDIDKSTSDLAEVLADKRAPFDRAQILFEYRKALAFSKYRNRSSLTKCLQEMINDNHLWDIVESRLAKYMSSPGSRPTLP